MQVGFADTRVQATVCKGNFRNIRIVLKAVHARNKEDTLPKINRQDG